MNTTIKSAISVAFALTLNVVFGHYGDVTHFMIAFTACFVVLADRDKA